MKKLSAYLSAFSLFLALGLIASVEAKERYYIRTVPSSNTHFVQAQILTKNKTFYVIGKVRRLRRGGNVRPILGHVDISLASPADRARRIINITLKQKRRPRRTAREASFRQKLGNVVLPGTRILMKYHEGPPHG